MSKLDFTDPAVLAALTEMLADARVDGLEISAPGCEIRLVVSSCGKVAKSSATLPSQKTEPSRAVVKAPIAGHFHASEADGEDPFIANKKIGQALGSVRIGHILVPVTTGRAGTVTRQLAEHGALVGFGDPLFEIELQS